MITIPEITKREFEILGHSLGIHPESNKRSKNKSDKKLPDEFYRNRFLAGPNHKDMPELDSLKEKGFMDTGHNSISTDTFFFVTELGEFRFRSEFKKFILS